MNTSNPSFEIVKTEELQDAKIDCLITKVENMVDSLKKRDKDYEKKELTPIYRGESKLYPYPLLPSIFREMAAGKKHPDYEKKLVNQFLNRHPIYKDDLLKILSIMQHYGSSTRLLDWTSQLEVALYFACVENLDEDGMLYIFVPTLTYQENGCFLRPNQAFYSSLKYHYFKQVLISHTEAAHADFWSEFAKLADKNVGDFSVPWWFVFEPELVGEANTREQLQKSVFTFHPGYVDGNKLCVAPPKSTKNFVKQHVGKLIIPAEFKENILTSLEAKGICAATLFPEPIYKEAEY